MTSTPAMGCDCCKWLNSRSAGGQLEQPSDVNNSTSTGVRGASAVAIAADIIIIHQVRIYDSCIRRAKTSRSRYKCYFSRGSGGSSPIIGTRIRIKKLDAIHEAE